MEKIFLAIIQYYEDKVLNNFTTNKLSDGTVEMDFFVFSIKLINDGRMPNSLKYAVEKEFYHLLRNNELEENIIEKLVLIKNLIPLIQENDFYSIEDLCSFTCKESRIHLYDKLETIRKLYM